MPATGHSEPLWTDRGSALEIAPPSVILSPVLRLAALILVGLLLARPTNAQRLHALLPNSESTVFPDAGHFSHEDADATWIDRLATFVGAHRPDDRTTHHEPVHPEPTEHEHAQERNR